MRILKVRTYIIGPRSFYRVEIRPVFDNEIAGGSVTEELLRTNTIHNYPPPSNNMYIVCMMSSTSGLSRKEAFLRVNRVVRTHGAHTTVVYTSVRKSARAFQ